MKVRDIMDTNVITVTTETPYSEVVKTIYEHHMSGVPVVDEKGEPVGFVTDKDILRVMLPHYQSYYEHPEAYTKLEDRERKALDIQNHRARTFMRTFSMQVRPDDAVMKVLGMMLAKHMSRLPVINSEGKLVGVISRKMIFQAIIRENFNL